jgi:hypothetical protein
MEAIGDLLDDIFSDDELDSVSEIEQNASPPPVDSDGDARMSPLDFETDEAADRERCVKALKLLNDAGYELHDLLDDVMFGNTAARNDPSVKRARRLVFENSTLTQVLKNVQNPPQRLTSLGVNHIKALAEIENWAIELTRKALHNELLMYAKTTRSPDFTEHEVVNEESLKSMTFNAIVNEVKTHAPKLFGLLTGVCRSNGQLKNQVKDSKLVSS